MKNIKHFFFLFFWGTIAVPAQSISGYLLDHGGQEIVLEGFDYFNTVALGKTQIDSLGNFNLSYPKDYSGMGLLKTQDNSSLVVLLSGENIMLQGSHLKETNGLVLSEGQNKTFFNYAVAHGQRKNALGAWKYLDKIYETSSTFAEQKKLRKAITAEINRLKNENEGQITRLPKTSYLRWFIPYRTFIQDMPVIIRTETERIPESIALFRTSDFNHPHWKTSGIMQEWVEKHYFMLENSSGTNKEIQEKMNQSSRHLIQNLQSNQNLLNQVVEKLFTLLEKRSLFIASEFVAQQVLNCVQCEIQENIANKLEKYRKLKVGSKAPDIQLSNTQKLSDYQQPMLLVFGKSDCSQCQKEAMELLKYYDDWKAEKNIEVVYISLDTDEKVYAKAYQNTPWPMFCDFKGWDSKAVKDFHIWSTPTYFLLDKDLKFLAHINSVAHADAWIKYSPKGL
jgi:peroxiredoxin